MSKPNPTGRPTGLYCENCRTDVMEVEIDKVERNECLCTLGKFKTNINPDIIRSTYWKGMIS